MFPENEKHLFDMRLVAKLVFITIFVVLMLVGIHAFIDWTQHIKEVTDTNL